MPAMDGLRLFNRIRADKTLNKTPILIITGLTKEYDLPKGFWKQHTGADGFLEKPFDMSQLRAEIERLIKYKLGKADFKPTGYL
jgi:DNA-binding response OmpR family regulator